LTKKLTRIYNVTPIAIENTSETIVPDYIKFMHV